jgi:soluble lytic murein transglycosylase
VKRGWVVATLVVCVACGRASAPPPQVQASDEPQTEPAVTSTAVAAGPAAAAPSAEAEDAEARLRALSSSDDAVKARQATAMLGLRYAAEKRDAEAIDLLDRAAALDADLAPYLQLRVVDSRRRTGDFPGAARTARAIMMEAPNSSAAATVAIALPGLYLQAGDRSQSEASLRALEATTIDELNEADFVHLGDQLESAGAPELAAATRLRILRQYPQGRFTERIYGQLTASSESPLFRLTFNELSELAARLGRFNRYDQALDLLRRLAQQYPAKAEDALYRSIRARSLFNSRNYSELVNDGTLDKPVAALQLVRARAYWRIDKPATFVSILKAIQAKYPGGRESVEADLLLAKYYATDEKNYGRSTASLERAIAAGAEGNDGENIWTLGWTYLLWGHDADALKAFDRYLAAYPDGDYRTNSLFWSAKILDRQGRVAERNARYEELIRDYPYSYYAYRSRSITGAPLLAPDRVENGQVFPDIAAAVAEAGDPRLEVVGKLESIGLVADATKEMKRIAADHPANVGIGFRLADFYLRTGEAAKANAILQKQFRAFIRHGGSNVPRRFWEILFPINYWSEIEPAARQRSVDPYLVAAIIRQESGFEPTDVSNAGAVGLMQIMPEEAARIAAGGGLPEPTRQMLFDPKTNVEVGALEYTQKLARVGGNQILAIAAYNAGEEAVGRWLAKTPADDVDLFVDSIPYNETRLYVKNVTRNQYEYRRIYEDRTTPGSASPLTPALPGSVSPASGPQTGGGRSGGQLAAPPGP